MLLVFTAKGTLSEDTLRLFLRQAGQANCHHTLPGFYSDHFLRNVRNFVHLNCTLGNVDT